MGLNESYGNIRSNVLAKRHVIIVNEAYAIVTQEESQRTLGVTDTLKDPLTMLAGKGYEFKPKRIGLICDHCGYKGHLKENCYKIVGYPPDFKSKKKGQNSRGKTYVNSATSEEKHVPMIPTQGNFFTEEQYKQLVNLLQKTTTDECCTNTAGIFTLMSNAGVSDQDWIVNSGATHHVTHCKNALNNLRKADHRADGVQLPTGSRAEITHTGDAVVLGNKTIEGVLYVPDFKFNILSVSKLTRKLCCSVGFYPDFCIFQGLYNGKVMGIGRENNGLYLIRENLSIAAISFLKEHGETTLRRLRLGHASTKAMQHISELKNKIQTGRGNNCETQFEATVKIVRSDNGTEFFNSQCNTLFDSLGIIHQSSCPYTPQQNGMVERKHRHILEVARALKFQSSIPKRFWGDCLELRRLFSLDTQKGYRLYDLENRSIFVSRDVVFKEQSFPFEKDVDSDCTEGLFASQPPVVEETRHQPQAPMITTPPQSIQVPVNANGTIEVETADMDLVTDHAECSDNHEASDNLDPAIVHVESDMHHEIPADDAANENLFPIILEPEVETSIEEAGSEDVHSQSPSIEGQTRKSNRQGKGRPPVWLKDYITKAKTHTNTILSPAYQSFLNVFSVLTEPQSFKEAAHDPRWIEAIDQEIRALEENHTWERGYLPKGKKHIGSKWVFKIKYKSSGEIDKFKARLVAKGYTQQEGLDYHETFSPVSKNGNCENCLKHSSLKRMDPLSNRCQ
ncbi:PREDICTED: uncharacterized protein LOC109215923 [Nicotiana attenuata]|uniref:uncharacterized protein LOC109215923 n=1 Tax=Nicotiana attenuata TaxID=49451 RepID=UPI000904AEE2|nr:PREDICTED: uncharacterized protein LOC109215923 [Nicotiana attenuata]